MGYDQNEMQVLANESDMLNMVNLRRGVRDALIRAARRFKDPTVSIVDDGQSVSITITEGAADAKAS